MNWLAHFWLADETGTSICGQFLGDYVKGPDLERFEPTIADGIRLHRAIDRISDNRPEYRALRRHLPRNISRYAPILADLGFDYSLARYWASYSTRPLAEYAASAESRILADWPANAPFAGQRIRGLTSIIADYDSPRGIRRALAGIESRLKRPAPLVAAFDEIEALASVFDAYLPDLMTDMRHAAWRAHTDLATRLGPNRAIRRDKALE